MCPMSILDQINYCIIYRVMVWGIIGDDLKTANNHYIEFFSLFPGVTHANYNIFNSYFHLHSFSHIVCPGREGEPIPGG